MKVKFFPPKKSFSLTKDRLTLEYFLELPSVPMQRDTLAHAKSPAVKNALSTLRPEHVNVALAKLTSDCYEGGIFYRAGTIFIVDGNTRQFYWKEGHSDYIPTHVEATIYEYDTLAEIQECYNTYDSKSALETNGQKIYGLLKLNHNYEAKYNKFANGKFSTSLGFASHVIDPVTYNKPSVSNNIYCVQDQIALFIDEIKVIDDLCYNIGTKITIMDQSLLAASMLALKHYGTTNKKLLKCLCDIYEERQNTQTKNMDGVTHIVQEWTRNFRFKQRTTSWDKPMGLSKTVPFVLFWIEKYMNDIAQKQIGGGWDNILSDWFGSNSTPNTTNNSLAKAFDIEVFENA